MKKIRSLAFYLPQYHPIPENDRVWGKGFTEWVNVAAARPVFRGHYQPHLPGELGFYDLRVPEVRQAQAELAKEYGIYGFCYYHYWFQGHRLLERPLDEILKSGQPDYPFCLCWANENWTRKWDGKDDAVIISQNYSEHDHQKHMQFLCSTFFQDHRYIRVNGKPLFLVYRTTIIPNFKKTVEAWRKEAEKFGIELYLCRIESFSEAIDPAIDGLDAAIEFQPDWLTLYSRLPGASLLSFLQKTKHWEMIKKVLISSREMGSNWIYEYKRLVENNIQRRFPAYKRFPCVSPMWDNTSRRSKGATILKGSTPELYEAWLRSAAERFRPYSEEENFIFINAWNEWAEGAHLEPCRKWGREYLEATQRAIKEYL